jgi:hypothetical protein
MSACVGFLHDGCVELFGVMKCEQLGVNVRLKRGGFRAFLWLQSIVIRLTKVERRNDLILWVS